MLESFNLETYHYIFTNETNGEQTVFNVPIVIENIDSFSTSFFDFLNNHTGHLDSDFIKCIKENAAPLLSYDVASDYVASSFEDELYFTTNGFYTLSLVKVNYANFNLMDFVKERQINEKIYYFKKRAQ